MKHKLAVGLALLLSWAFLISPTGAVASVAPVFQLETIVENGKEIRVEVQASHLVDTYAYELNINFDKLRLKLIEAQSEIPGFAIPPVAAGDDLRIAFTKVGKVPGMNGNATLATLTFERIRGGDAAVELREAKLVDSKLEMTKHSVQSKVVFAGLGDLAPMSDLAGHWAEAIIAEAVELGFVTGYEDGTFRPQNEVTRAEFAALLVRALQLPASSAIEERAAFADHESIALWTRPYVYAAAEAKLVGGYTDGTFRADQRITRSEMAAMLVRALDGKQEEAAQGTVKRYGDNELIPVWAAGYVEEAVQAGLMQGKGNNRFAPNDNTVRAEAVAAIMNLLRQV